MAFKDEILEQTNKVFWVWMGILAAICLVGYIFGS